MSNNPFNPFADQDPLRKHESFNRMSFTPNTANITTGNAVLDMIISMFMSGSGIAPRPIPGQSIQNAYLQRDRSRDMLQAWDNSFANQLAFQRLGGFNTSNMAGQVAKMAIGMPDSWVMNKLLAPFNGGNPIQAQMGLLSNMTGPVMQMGFGRTNNLTGEESNRMMQSVYRTAFNNKVIDNNDLRDVGKDLGISIAEELKRTPVKQEVFKDFFKTLDGKDVFDIEKFEKLKETTENFTKGVEGLSDEFKKAGIEMSQSSQALKDFRNFRDNAVGTYAPTSINYQATRGFEVQDLTRILPQAIETGMFNALKHQKTGQGFEKGDLGVSAFLTSAAQIMRAVADLTGAETADQAFQQFNSLIGAGSFDFGDKNLVNQTELAIRGLSATGRIAGVNSQTLISMINDIKAQAGQSGSLHSLGGHSTIDMTRRATVNTMLAAQMLGPDYVRKMGGTAQMAREMASSEVAQRTEPGVERLKALYAMVADSTLSDQEKEKLFGEIDSFASRTDMAMVSQNAWQPLYSKVASKLGVNRSHVAANLNTEALHLRGDVFLQERARAGKESPVISGEAGKNMAYQHFSFLLSQEASIRYGGDKRFKNLSTGEELNAKQVYAKVMDEIAGGADLVGTFNKYGLLGLTQGPVADKYFNWNTEQGRRFMTQARMKEMELRDPELAKKYKTMIDAAAADDQATSERLAHLNQPILSLVAQETMRGTLGKGTKGIMDVFSTPAAKQRSEAMLKAGRDLSTLSKEHLPQGLIDAFMQSRGGIGTEDQIVSNLRDEGKNNEEIKAILAQRRAMQDSGGYSAFMALADKDATLNSILTAAAGSKEDFLKSDLHAKGVTWEQVQQAAGFVKNTGIGNASNLANYGDAALNEDTRKNIMRDELLRGTHSAILEDTLKTLELGVESGITNEMNLLKERRRPKETDEQFKARQSRAEQLDAALGGIVKTQKGIKFDGDKMDKDIADGKLDPEMAKKLTEMGLIQDGKVRRHKLHRLIGEGKLNPELADQIKSAGYVTDDPTKDKALGRDYDKIAEIFGTTRQKEGETKEQFEARSKENEKIRERFKGTPMGERLERYAKMREETEKKLGGAGGDGSPGGGGDTGKLLESLISALGTNSGKIIEALSKLSGSIDRAAN